MRTTRAVVVATILGFVLVGCEGPMGPEGPQGLAGPQGPKGDPGEPGPGTRIVRSGTLNADGAGLVHLPESVGTITNPPAVACYVAETSDADVWLVIATSNAAGACGLLDHGQHVDVAIVESEPFWASRIVAVF